MQDNAIKTILHGRRIGTFFTDSGNGGEHATTDVLAENGKEQEHVVFCIPSEAYIIRSQFHGHEVNPI
jgi:hypothetical protein